MQNFLKTFGKVVDLSSLVVKDLRKTFHQLLGCFTYIFIKFPIGVSNWLNVASKSFSDNCLFSEGSHHLSN